MNEEEGYKNIDFFRGRVEVLDSQIKDLEKSGRILVFSQEDVKGRYEEERPSQENRGVGDSHLIPGGSGRAASRRRALDLAYGATEI